MLEMGPTGQEAGVRWEESRRSLLGVGPEQQHEGWPFTDRENCRSNSGGHVDGQISASRAQGRAWIHMLDFFFFFGCPSQFVGSQFPEQGFSLCPQQ